MKRIASHDDIAQGLAALAELDPRLVPVIHRAGDVPLRLTPPGFASLASIVVSQQISRASAEAIWNRLIRIVDPLEPAGVLRAGEDGLREAGLSRPKQKTLLAIARGVSEYGLDLEHLAATDPDEAMARLTSLHGVGPWTAQVYLLFSAGHPDIFPAHDVALQSAVGDALAITPRPSVKMLHALAESWSPWRGVAARLFWAYYREVRGREALPPA